MRIPVYVHEIWFPYIPNSLFLSSVNENVQQM